MSNPLEVIKFNHKIVIKEPVYESVCAKIHVHYKYQSPSDIAYLHESMGRHVNIQRSLVDSINDTYLSRHDCLPPQEIDFSPVLTQITAGGETTIFLDLELRMVVPTMPRAHLTQKLVGWVRDNFPCHLDAVKVTIK
jgi:hypothetical protein